VELSAFGTVGAICFVIDIGLFQLLYAELAVGAVTAKVLATLVSMTVAFFGHRHWSFSSRAHPGARQEYVLFTLINLGTLALGAAVIALVRYPLGQDGVLAIQAANIGSIVLCSAVRWFTYRAWVFPAVRADADDGERRAVEDDAHIAA
jgi:putative flippase GtrA